MTLIEIVEKSGRKVEDITKIYHGKDRWCRCGCGGNYFYANHKEDSRGFKRAITTINKPTFDLRDTELDYGSNYINIPYDAENLNRCYCVYFD